MKELKFKPGMQYVFPTEDIYTFLYKEEESYYFMPRHDAKCMFETMTIKGHEIRVAGFYYGEGITFLERVKELS